MANEPEPTFTFNGQKFQFGFRDLIYIVGLIVAVAFFYFGSKSEDASHDKSIAGLEQKYDDLTTAIVELNRKITEEDRQFYSLQYQVNQNSREIDEWKKK